MEELQNHIRGLGMKKVIYDATFERLDLAKFSAGMKDLILEQAPPHQYGLLVPVFKPFRDLRGHYPANIPVGG